MWIQYTYFVYEKDYFNDFISNNLSTKYLNKNIAILLKQLKKHSFSLTSLWVPSNALQHTRGPTVKCRYHLPLKSFDDTFCIYISCFTGNRIVRNACIADIGSRHPAALRRRRCADKDYSAPSYTDDTLHRKRLALSPPGPLKCKQSKVTLMTSHKKPRILKNK